MKMDGRVAIVTGAASGMGKAISKKLLKEGSKVIGFSLEETCNINDPNFIYYSGNVCILEDCKKVVEKAIKTFGKIDCLVNSAGITREGTLETTTLDTFKLTFEINVFGVFNMCKATIKELKKHTSTIVNISSDMSKQPLKERISYNPSKAAVNMLTECIALDYAPNIRANTIMPGVVHTPMIEKRLHEADNPEDLLNFYKSIYPLERIGTVDDITNAVLFLSTKESSWMTGGHLPICGGSL